MKSICLRGEIHLLALLLASCQLRNFPREFTEKCFALFDQSSCAIYLMWYQPLLFFWEFFLSFFLRYDFKILVKSWGRGYIFKSSIVILTFGRSNFFFKWKLNISSFIFLIWTEKCWIWFRWKLTKTIEISIVF